MGFQSDFWEQMPEMSPRGSYFDDWKHVDNHCVVKWDPVPSAVCQRATNMVADTDIGCQPCQSVVVPQESFGVRCPRARDPVHA